MHSIAKTLSASQYQPRSMRHKGFMGKYSNRLNLICGTIFCSLATVETKTSESNDVKYPSLLEMNHYQKNSSFERTRKINRFEKFSSLRESRAVG